MTSVSFSSQYFLTAFVNEGSHFLQLPEVVSHTPHTRKKPNNQAKESLKFLQD